MLHCDELLVTELSDEREVDGVNALGGGTKRLELMLPGKGLEKCVDRPLVFEDGDAVPREGKSTAGGR